MNISISSGAKLLVSSIANPYFSRLRKSGNIFVMRLRFNEAKVTEAAVYLLKRRGGRMHYLKLLKLLYLADRAALLKWGRPISTDRYVSMDHGPVLSVTLNLINGGYVDFGGKWDKVISAKDGAEVELSNPEADFVADELSRAEEDLLSEIFDQYGHWNRWKIVDYLHSLPEWQDPNGSAIPISYRDILLAGKKTPAEISIVEEELESLSAVENILS
jgi:uncharacterized phage-associated protein